MHNAYPPLIHGHLSSHNIFVESDKHSGIKVYIDDLALSPFIKYAILLNDYKAKSVWSAPEILKDIKNKEITKEMDVYSFGMILW